MTTDNKYITVTIRFPRFSVDHLKKVCLTLSKQQGKLVTLSEFIRSTILEMYPQKKQMDLFKAEKLRLKKKKCRVTQKESGAEPL